MLHALIVGSVVAGAGWCWAKLVAPWVRTHEFHEEVMEIQRELAVPPGQPWARELDTTQDLANLAAAIGVGSGIAISGDADIVTVPNHVGKQIRESRR